MKFTKVYPYGPDAYCYWFSGIYKIVKYENSKGYSAFYITDHHKNWGEHVETPPKSYVQQGMDFTYWPSFRNAVAACKRHAKKYTPAPATVRRAAEIFAATLEQAEEYTQ